MPMEEERRLRMGERERETAYMGSKFYANGWRRMRRRRKMQFELYAKNEENRRRNVNRARSRKE